MSFRGKIAIPIKSKLNLLLNEHHRFSADIVEYGGFIASINFILSIEVGMTDGVKAFQKRYKDYIGLSYNEIPLSVAETIYHEFSTLLSDKD